MRLKSLDTLRGIAVLLVLFSHSYPLGDDVPSYLKAIHQYLYYIGWCGVDLFFVLSGFLISGLIFNEINKTETFSPRRFLIRRGFKIYPLFYSFIVITIIYRLVRHHDIPYSSLFAEIFYFQNYVQGLWTHTWSLAVEEHFYFLIAIVFSLAMVKNTIHNRSLGKYLVAALILILILRICVYYFIYNGERIRLYSHHRMDSLLFGVLLSYFNTYYPEVLKKYRSALKYSIIPLIIIVLWSVHNSFGTEYMKTIGFTVLYLCFGLMLIYSYMNEKYFSRLKILPFIGVYSYSIYLFHMVFKFWGLNTINLLVKPNSFVNFLIYMAGSILMGVVFTKLIEKPFLKIRDKYFPSVTTATVKKAQLEYAHKD
jgi:peptidoglycan/LPS O-acetylase OafA/YrhL